MTMDGFSDECRNAVDILGYRSGEQWSKIRLDPIDHAILSRSSALADLVR